MTRGRHSLASRSARVRRLSLIAAPLVTCAAVGTGVALTGSSTDAPDLAARAGADISAPVAHPNAVSERSASVSRSAARVPVAKVPVAKAKLWTTADLDLRTTPDEDATTKGEVDRLSKVAVTGLRRAGYAQVLVAKKAYWVTAEYLVAKKPTDPAHLPIADKPCPGTSGVESGITDAAVKVYRAVCNNFPQITRYGGYDAHGEHSSGRALDIMTRDVTLGTAIAEFLRANAAELHIYDVIWRQHIFTQQRGGEGWRSMPNRGSATANHYDHVHVSVY